MSNWIILMLEQEISKIKQSRYFIVMEDTDESKEIPASVETCELPVRKVITI